MNAHAEKEHDEIELTPLPRPYSLYAIDLKALVVYNIKKKKTVKPFYRKDSPRTFYKVYLDYRGPKGELIRDTVQRGELVLRAAQGAPRHEKFEVSHLDNDPTNDHRDNLAWESKGGNIDRYNAKHSHKGSKNPNAKLFFRKSVHVLRAKGRTVKEIAEGYGVHVSTIYRELKNPKIEETEVITSDEEFNPFLDHIKKESP